MGWFYHFKPEDVNSLTMYQLRGYLRQIGEIQKLLNGVEDDKRGGSSEGAVMTDDEKRSHAAKCQAVIRESMRAEYEAGNSIC